MVGLVVSVGNEVRVTALANVSVESFVGELVLARVSVEVIVSVASISGVVLDEHPVNINRITNNIKVIL